MFAPLRARREPPPPHPPRDDPEPTARTTTIITLTASPHFHALARRARRSIRCRFDVDVDPIDPRPIRPIARHESLGRSFGRSFVRSFARSRASLFLPRCRPPRRRVAHSRRSSIRSPRMQCIQSIRRGARVASPSACITHTSSSRTRHYDESRRVRCIHRPRFFPHPAGAFPGTVVSLQTTGRDP